MANRTLLFLTSGFGDNLLSLPLALELEAASQMTAVAPSGPQADFFARCLPGARIIPYDRSPAALLKVLTRGWACDTWIYPIGACTRKLRLLHLAAPHRRAIGFTSLNSRQSWQAEIGFDSCLMPNLARAAWRNNLRLLPLIGVSTRRSWEDHVTRLRSRLPSLPKDPSLLVIHPGSARYAGGIERYKRWPLERFMTVADRLLREHVFERAAWVLGPDDRDLETPLRALMASPSATAMEIVSYQRFGGSLIDMGAFLSSAGHMLTNDSGLAHLASFYDVPLTSLSSGLGEPSYTGQNGRRSRVIIESTECYGCAVGISTEEAEKFACGFDWACMDRIRPDAVFEAVRAVASHVGV